MGAFGAFHAAVSLENGFNALDFEAVLATPDGEWTISCALELTASCEGCTYTQGYWRNHHRYSPRPNQEIAWPIDEDTELCGQTWLENLRTPAAGNVFYVVSHQWIAASLNAANGASTPPEVVEALDTIEAMLADCEIDDSEREEALAHKDVLDFFNNGEIGPGHCDDGAPGGGTDEPASSGGEPTVGDDPAQEPQPRGLRRGLSDREVVTNRPKRR